MGHCLQAIKENIFAFADQRVIDLQVPHADQIIEAKADWRFYPRGSRSRVTGPY